MSLRSSLAGVCLALIALLAPVSASAAVRSSGLDPTYGHGGMSMTSFGVAGELARVELSTTADGAAVVADGLEGTATRFGANGVQDRAFGRAGRLVLPSGTTIGGPKMKLYPSSISTDHRGRVLVFGERIDQARSVGGPDGSPVYASSAIVLRFNPAGDLEKSFGDRKGYVAGDFGLPQAPGSGLPSAGVLTGRVDSRNRPLFVVGSEGPVGGCQGHGGLGSVPRALVRLTESGRPDRTFGGGDGISPLEGSGTFPILALDAADQPAVGVGRVGSVAASCGRGTRVYRFGAEGEPMGGFGPMGFREFSSVHLALSEPGGGTILSEQYGRSLKLVAVGPDGEGDERFGKDGVARLRLPVKVGLNLSPAAVDSRGRILLAGFVGSPIAEPEKGQPKQSSFVVARLLPDGKVDRSFGKNGWIFTRLPAPLELNATQASLDPKGRLVVAGVVTKPKHHDGAFAVARYLLGP
jgi:hypothetical protein